VLSKEEYETTYSSYLKAKEELSNAREALEIVKEGISSSTASYSNTQIKSTITGMILDIPVKVGSSVIQTNNFNEGTTIATIADMKI
jgi:HlyD family secretion protein